jgi:hypothetical protein
MRIELRKLSIEKFLDHWAMGNSLSREAYDWDRGEIVWFDGRRGKRLRQDFVRNTDKENFMDKMEDVYGLNMKIVLGQYETLTISLKENGGYEALVVHPCGEILFETDSKNVDLEQLKADVLASPDNLDGPMMGHGFRLVREDL